MTKINLINKFKAKEEKNYTNWHSSVNVDTTMRIVARNTNTDKSSSPRYNDTTEAFQEIIKYALKNNLDVRALGGTWSFSDVAATKGILVDTWPLNYRFPLRKKDVHKDYSGKASNLLFVQCGNTIATLNKYLEANDKSLKTTGASNGQTIAGALSTGTHGSAIKVGSIAEYVRSIHLIVSPDKSVWIERASAPTVDDFFAFLFAKQPADEIIRCDDVFNAALVSFGSFGIIAGVVIETEELFYLNATRKFMEFNVGMWKAITKLDFSCITTSFKPPVSTNGKNEPYHFKVVIDPNKRDKVAATIIYKSDKLSADCKEHDPGSKSAVGDDAYSLIGLITDLLGTIEKIFGGSKVKDAISSLFESQYKEYSNVCGTIGETFSDTTTRGKASSTAMGIPMDRVEEALDLVFKEYDKNWAPVIVALRYVHASKGTLAFTNQQPITCILEIDGPRSSRVTSLTEKIWDSLDTAGIPYTFHWGKLNNLTAANVKKRYGNGKVESWKKARKRLLKTPQLRKVFANDFLRRLNLHD